MDNRYTKSVYRGLRQSGLAQYKRPRPRAAIVMAKIIATAMMPIVKSKYTPLPMARSISVLQDRLMPRTIPAQPDLAARFRTPHQAGTRKSPHGRPSRRSRLRAANHQRPSSAMACPVDVLYASVLQGRTLEITTSEDRDVGPSINALLQSYRQYPTASV